MQRYFISDKQINNGFIEIIGNDYFHITRVMRMKIGDKAYFCDEKNTYIASLNEIQSERVIFSIVDTVKEHKELPFEVTIAHGIVRREKMEEVIDYITELGASYYLPVKMEFSVVKFEMEKFIKKNERLQTIAKEAAEQSHRQKMMRVLEPCDFASLIELSKKYDLCLFAYEKASPDDSLKFVLKNNSFKSVLILVGPEGGISPKEKELLLAASFKQVSLGPRILRTQVAPLYVMSALSYEWEE